MLTSDTVAARRPATGRRALTWGGVVGLLVVIWGWRIGLRPLGDNSFLTHLATGRFILDHGIPRHDPYSFTAPGTPWTVQSWLASVLYGLTDRLGGWRALQLLTGLTTLALAAIIWRLSSPARGVIARLLIAGLALAVGTGTWSERPLLFGLVFFTVALLAAEDRIDARWLIPVFWLWVNIHGSFPLGLLVLGLLAVGRWADGARPSAERRALTMAALGTLLGAINPLGPSLIVFPGHLLARQSILRHIIEWQAPSFTTWPQRLFLMQIALAVLLLARRPSWRLAVPFAVLVPMALLSARNMNVASIVLVIAMAPAAAGLGGLGSDEPAVPAARAGLGALIVLGVILSVSAFLTPAVDFKDYPTKAVAWLDAHTSLRDERIAAPDYVGNYLEYAYGGAVKVFVDDRAEMYPKAVYDDFITVLAAKPDWEAALQRRAVTAVIWPADGPLTSVLSESSHWSIVYRDRNWIVARPRAS